MCTSIADLVEFVKTKSLNLATLIPGTESASNFGILKVQIFIQIKFELREPSVPPKILAHKFAAFSKNRRRCPNAEDGRLRDDRLRQKPQENHVLSHRTGTRRLVRDLRVS